jgi:hypothetical protein
MNPGREGEGTFNPTQLVQSARAAMRSMNVGWSAYFEGGANPHGRIR